MTEMNVRKIDHMADFSLDTWLIIYLISLVLTMANYDDNFTGDGGGDYLFIQIELNVTCHAGDKLNLYHLK